MGQSFEKTPKPIEDGVQAIVDIRTDICPFCKSRRVELFSFNNYPQNYKEAVDYHLMGFDIAFDKYEIRSMKCRSCGKEFVIDWTNGFPVPLKSTCTTTIFLTEFLNGI